MSKNLGPSVAGLKHEELQFLISEGYDVNGRDDKSNTALCNASFAGLFAHVKLLIEHGAKVNDRGYNGVTALICSVMGPKDREMIVAYLIEHKANVNQLNDKGYSALRFATQYYHPLVVNRLLKAGADPNLVDYETGSTPLIQCVYSLETDDITVPKMLLEAGAVNLLDRSNITAEMIATNKGFDQIGKMIRKFDTHP